MQPRELISVKAIETPIYEDKPLLWSSAYKRIKSLIPQMASCHLPFSPLGPITDVELLKSIHQGEK